MSELIKKDISSEFDLGVEWKDGKLRLALKYDGKGLDGGLFMDVEAEYLIKKIAEKIPGEVDDMILNGMLEALK